MAEAFSVFLDVMFLLLLLVAAVSVVITILVALDLMDEPGGF